MPINYANTSEQYDVVISGMGPAGLASAWEAGRAGKRVLIISNRGKDFIRVQTMYLQPKYRQYLLKMKEVEIPESLHNEQVPVPFDENETQIRELAGVPIKNIERYIFDRICRLPISIDVVLNSEIVNVDTVKGQIHFKSNENEHDPLPKEIVSFEFLVCADGTKHHAVNVANADLPKSKRIMYNEGPAPITANHFSAYLSVSRRDSGSLLLPEKINKKKKSKIFNLLGTEQAKQVKSANNRLFIVFINRFSVEKSEGRHVKISLSGEVPKHVAKIKDVEQKKIVMLEYLKKFIRKSFFKHIGSENLEVDVTPSSSKHGVKKDRLKLSFFTTVGSTADRALIQLNKCWIILVADAFQSPNYQTGLGINDAFAHSAAVGYLLTRNKITQQDAHDFTTQSYSRVNKMKNKTTLINLASSFPYIGKSTIARLSWINEKEMAKWLKSLEVAEQNISRVNLTDSTYFAHTDHHKVELFSNSYNDATRKSGIFFEIQKSIQDAEHFIFISIWCISLTQNLGMEKTLGQSLIDAEKRGVKIFILAWHSKLKTAIDQHTNENIKFLQRYQPKNLYYKKCIPGEQLLDKIFFSHHQKYIVTDEKAFICGMNLSPKSVDSFEHDDLGGIMWHDAGVMIQGAMLQDLFNEFFSHWSAQPSSNMLYNSDKVAIESLDALKYSFQNYSYYETTSEFRDVDRSIQLLVSKPQSNKSSSSERFGLFYASSYSRPSNQIHQAMIEAINYAKNYIIFATQYFIGCDENHEQSANLISLALIKRIQLAHLRGEEFHVYFNITAQPGAGDSGKIVDSILVEQWKTLRFLIDKITEKTHGNAEKYITFIELGKYHPSTKNYYQIYVHSKFLLTPNEIIIGSANLNERSLTSNRDTESCVRIRGYSDKIRDFTHKIIREYFGSALYGCLEEADSLDNLALGKSRQIIEAYLSEQLVKLSPGYYFAQNNYVKIINPSQTSVSNETPGCAMPWGLISKKDLLALVKPNRIPGHNSVGISIANCVGGKKYTR